MNMTFGSGRSRLIGRGITYPVPIPLDATAYDGAVVKGANGLLHTAHAGQWIASADDARVAQIAADVAANVFRVLEANVALTVGPGTEVFGSHYNTLGAALAFCSNYSPTYRNVSGLISPVMTVTIASGVQLSEQIILNGVNLGHVVLTSVDPVVDVLASGLSVLTDPLGFFHDFIRLERATAPTILNSVFKQVGTVPQDAAAIAAGFSAGYTPVSIGCNANQSSTIVARGSVGADLWAGFNDFSINCRLSASSSGSFTNGNLRSATLHGLLVGSGSVVNMLGMSITGCGTNSVRVTGNSQVFIFGQDSGAGAGVGGSFGNDFRRVSGQNNITDIVVVTGGHVLLPAASLYRGGLSIAVNTLLPAGYINAPDAASPGIVQRISNANGEVTRFQDGTQICWNNALAFSNANTADGALFRSGAVLWTFPAVFVGTPAVSGGIDDVDCWASFGTPSTVGCNVRVRSSVTKASALNGRAMAVGRWF